MTINKSTLSIAMGGVFAVSMAASAVAGAAQNPFAMARLDKGYMVAEADMSKDGKMDSKMKDGKCGEGKCGATTTKAKAKESKAGKESKAAGDKAKIKEGACGAGQAKMKDGSCGSAKK